MEAGLNTVNVELHCHTHFSSDSLLRPHDLLKVARRKGLDRVAITDHNTIEGAQAAAQLDPERVIIGEEILTTKGELLGYFLKEQVPAHLSPQETIERLRNQGAVISVSHPFDAHRKGAWEPEDLATILPMVDALEVFNARTITMEPNRQAAEWADRAGLLGTAGSDAHAKPELGQVIMKMPSFQNAPEFLQALGGAKIQGKLSSPFVHFYSRWAVWRKEMGWEA